MPHVRDRLQQLGHRAALAPTQIAVAASLTAAASEAIRADDFLLCSVSQAQDLGLTWRHLAGEPVARGYSASALTGDDAQRVRVDLREHVARALGAAAENEERA